MGAAACPDPPAHLHATGSQHNAHAGAKNLRFDWRSSRSRIGRRQTDARQHNATPGERNTQGGAQTATWHAAVLVPQRFSCGGPSPPAPTGDDDRWNDRKSRANNSGWSGW
jgi:hypothetical protein